MPSSNLVDEPEINDSECDSSNMVSWQSTQCYPTYADYNIKAIPIIAGKREVE